MLSDHYTGWSLFCSPSERGNSNPKLIPHKKYGNSEWTPILNLPKVEVGDISLGSFGKWHVGTTDKGIDVI